MAKKRAVLVNGNRQYLTKEEIANLGKNKKESKEIPASSEVKPSEPEVDPADLNGNGRVSKKEALQHQCEELGIKWKRNWTIAKLEKAIENHELEEDL